LRYGENPHQTAAFYRDNAAPGGVAHARQLAGKELSFNNIVDLESAYAIVADFETPAAAVIKHTNPCGAATADDIATAYKLAYEADPVSAFGSIVGLNRPVDVATAEQLKTIFLEAVIAPAFDAAALEILGAKKNVRLLEAKLPATGAKARYDIKTVSGGIVIQSTDTQDAPPAEWKTVTKRAPTAAELKELELAWKVVKHVKSNAIVGRSDCRRGSWTDEPGRCGRDRPETGRRSGQGRRDVLGCFFPVPGYGRRGGQSRCNGNYSAGRIGSR
jgi:phosphoribosylaminoimidazolecarboxamide formyltransferase/IMP cyclohydrolase